jgi:S1-C subfamily serine protease
MDSNVAKELSLEFVQGAVIIDLDAEGSAAKSGVIEHDIVTKANGKVVNSTSELLEQIGRSKVGETLVLTVMRNNKPQEIPVRLRSKTEGN